jgi:carboxyl-terminal processing protease
MCFSFRLSSLFLSFISLPVLLTAQTSETIHAQVLTLKRTIELNHYNPRPVDDDFSAQLYDRFMAHIDEDKTYLTSADLKTLSAYRLSLDDELNGKGWEFLNKLMPLYKMALQKADSLATMSKDGRAIQHEIRKTLNHPSGYENYVASLYCDVIANLFDPHTEYMPLEEKQDFETALDKKGYYFGFSLEENANGDTEIGRLVPGSPAWKCGDLNKGDVVTSIGWEGKEPVNVSGLPAGEIAALLQSADTAKLRLTVKKQDGIEKTISLTRAKIDNEENNVRGYVLRGKIPVGYIYLPDFYTAHESGYGSCANDVAKEIVKLKKENIAGLILDIRYNGGGSLQEALDMAGIFIDAGPLVMIKEKTGKIISLKDPNRGTIYDGPMTLLVNGQSASASELLGAVLQDYHRAVIVGSTTFGKGSAQIIFPVDTNTAIPLPSRSTQYGFVKITTSKFYRVTGGTTQHAGVTPDIILPDIFDGLNYHESALPSALSADTIKKNAYYAPLPGLPLAPLAAKSKLRIDGDQNFAVIKKYSELLKEGKPADSTIDFSSVRKPASEYAVAVNAFDASMLKSDAYRDELTTQWIKKISSDKYVEEAYNILNDLINNNVNN